MLRIGLLQHSFCQAHISTGVSRRAQRLDSGTSVGTHWDPKRVAKLLVLVVLLALRVLGQEAEKRVIKIPFVGGFISSSTNDPKSAVLLEAEKQISALLSQEGYDVQFERYYSDGKHVDYPNRTLASDLIQHPDWMKIMGCFSAGCSHLQSTFPDKNVDYGLRMAILIEPYSVLPPDRFENVLPKGTEVVVQVKAQLPVLGKRPKYPLGAHYVLLVSDKLHPGVLKDIVKRGDLTATVVSYLAWGGAFVGPLTSSGGAGIESFPITDIKSEAFSILSSKRYWQRRGPR